MTDQTQTKQTMQLAGDLPVEAVAEISAALRKRHADAFSLYLKTKGFYWHMRGPHFRDYHLMLDEQSGQMIDMTDGLAERARKLGGGTLGSIGDISRHQRLVDNDEEHVPPMQMLPELPGDNRAFAGFLREAHHLCDWHGDVATASLVENWTDQAERRTWSLSESA